MTVRKHTHDLQMKDTSIAQLSETNQQLNEELSGSQKVNHLIYQYYHPCGEKFAQTEALVCNKSLQHMDYVVWFIHSAPVVTALRSHQNAQVWFPINEKMNSIVLYAL